MRVWKFQDYDMSCLDRFQLQQDQLEACREAAANLASMLIEARDMGCLGPDLASSFQPLLDIIPLLKV